MEKFVIKSTVYSFLSAAAILIVCTPIKRVEYNGTGSITIYVNFTDHFLTILRVSLAVGLIAGVIAVIVATLRQRK